MTQTETPPKKKSYDDDLRRIFKSLETSNQTVTSIITSEDNTEIQPGNSIITKSRIFSGETNRLANLFDYLILRGCNKDKIAALRTTVFGASIGYCKDIPDFGMRGEALDLVRPSPKKEQQQTIPNQTIDNNQKQPQQGEMQN
jgi:hypothetical protein